VTIQSLADVADAHAAGRVWTGYMRRATPTQVAGSWVDMSYGAGIPAANYYASAPLTAASLSGLSPQLPDTTYDITSEGIYPGSAVNEAGFKKYLQKTMIVPPATSIGQATLMNLDVVMFYPFVDGDGGVQAMTNVLTIPRYGGRGCQIMAVGQGVGVANGTAIITYTNSDGVAGRTTLETAVMGTLGAGVLWSNDIGGVNLVGSAPFFGLQMGDRGVKSIESINVVSAIGGIFALAIVKPLGVIPIMEATVNPHEIDFVRERMQFHEIEDGAYVSMISRATIAAAPAVMQAEHTFVWG
jgi:hypothetical protein